jgi:glycolate oxidase FAD binding subunit
MTVDTHTRNPQTPGSQQEVADLLAEASENELGVRILGAGTKASWGYPTTQPLQMLRTTCLDEIVEHNEGDLTAILEAGVPLAKAQELFSKAGQRLSLDPPSGDGSHMATIGGVVASGDSGPLRHRYGAPRDLVVGMTVALSDGTLAQSGGKVIKNVAGYDLAKLFSGSFGTLGVITQVCLRLHPDPGSTATLSASSDDPVGLMHIASTLSHAPAEKECLDVRWNRGSGVALARFAGVTSTQQAEACRSLVTKDCPSAELIAEDTDVWEAQRAAQRSTSGTVVRVSTVQTSLASVFSAADQVGGLVVARVALGLCWVNLGERTVDDTLRCVEHLRNALAPATCVVLDAPEEVRGALKVWHQSRAGTLELARRVKRRFDSTQTCNPGIFVGGI